MFLIAAAAYAQLCAHARTVAPTIACGLLLGKKQGGITQIVPLTNCAAPSANSWQFDPKQFQEKIIHIMVGESRLQGIYYTCPDEPQPPPVELMHRWHHDVPCFVISLKTASVRAFAIDSIAGKTVEVVVVVEPTDPRLTNQAIVSETGVTLGRDSQTDQPVRLSPQARGLSTYVIGGMGMGKSTLLLNLVMQDIERGEGVAVIEPHGDLIEDILRRVPLRREPDVILWEPFETTAPFGLNLFACSDIHNTNLVDQVCSQVIGTFYKLFAESWGPRMDELFRAAALTLIANQDLPSYQRPTLAELPELLLNDAYQHFLVSRVKNQRVKAYWTHQYQPLKAERRLEYAEPVLNKVNRFLHNETILHIVGQAESSLNLRQIMDEGKILLVNLAKGALGEDNSNLLGSTLIGQFLTATLTRGELPVAKRQPYHLVVDEYQNFATQTFLTLQTEARKYGVDTIVAHQTRSMLDVKSKGATGAVGNLICFAVAGADAQELALMFNNQPPEPPVVGVQPVRTLSTSPWDHLTRYGHSNPQITQLVTALQSTLVPLPKKNLPNYKDDPLRAAYDPTYLEVPTFPLEDVRLFIIEEDVRRFEQLLNLYLHERMQGTPAAALQEALTQLQRLGPFYTQFQYYRGPGYLVVLTGKTNDEFIIFSGARGQQLRVDQQRRQQAFYAQLERLAFLLTQTPIFTESGQFQEVRDKPRLFSDVMAETANTLSSLKRYHAICRIIDSHDNRIQQLIQTDPPPPLPAVANGDAFTAAAARTERLKQQSQHRYGRPRRLVAQQLQERLEVSAPPRPALSKRARVAAASAPPTPEQADSQAPHPNQPSVSLWEPLDPAE